MIILLLRLNLSFILSTILLITSNRSIKRMHKRFPDMPRPSTRCTWVPRPSLRRRRTQGTAPTDCLMTSLKPKVSLNLHFHPRKHHIFLRCLTLYIVPDISIFSVTQERECINSTMMSFVLVVSDCQKIPTKSEESSQKSSHLVIPAWLCLACSEFIQIETQLLLNIRGAPLVIS